MKTKYEAWKNIQNYVIIAIVSVVCLCVLPFLSSEMGVAMILPNTFAGWLVFVFTKVIVGVVNILLLYCFVEQGKLNIQDDERYLAALRKYQQFPVAASYIPISPAKHYRHIYTIKGSTIFITSVLSTFTLTYAVLSFDLATFITYFITILFGVIFGAMQMVAEEKWWVSDFPLYVDYLLEQQKSAQQSKKEIKNDTSDNQTT